MLYNIFGYLFCVMIWGEFYGLVLGCIVDGILFGIELNEGDI